MSICYPSDLTDAEWECVKRYLPSLSRRGRPRTHPLRRGLDAIFYVLRAGCVPWLFAGPLRGYLQGLLEGMLGGVAAILLTTLLMAPEHALTQGFVWPTLLFYAVVDVMLGTMAFLTQSILPGIVTHAIGLLVFFTIVWPADVIRQVVGIGATEQWFWIHAAQMLIFAALAILAFARLARSRKQAQNT